MFDDNNNMKLAVLVFLSLAFVSFAIDTLEIEEKVSLVFAVYLLRLDRNASLSQ